MSSVSTHKPLSEAQLDRLQALLGRSSSADAMNVERFDGFLAALIVGPDMVMPSEYLPRVWGGESADDSGLADPDELKEFLALLMQHWNGIADTLEAGDVYVPIFLEDANGITQGRDWAKGFMQGVNLRRHSWAELIADEQESGAILPIALMAGEVDPDWPPEPLTDEKREEILMMMAAGLVRIHRYFKPHRSALARAGREEHTYRREYPKIGRNDPCPCGSGKKYKHCCARNDDGMLH
jgi:uncharacterized protein